MPPTKPQTRSAAWARQVAGHARRSSHRSGEHGCPPPTMKMPHSLLPVVEARDRRVERSQAAPRRHPSGAARSARTRSRPRRPRRSAPDTPRRAASTRGVAGPIVRWHAQRRQRVVVGLERADVDALPAVAEEHRDRAVALVRPPQVGAEHAHGRGRRKGGRGGVARRNERAQPRRRRGGIAGPVRCSYRSRRRRTASSPATPSAPGRKASALAFQIIMCPSTASDPRSASGLPHPVGSRARTPPPHGYRHGRRQLVLDRSVRWMFDHGHAAARGGRSPRRLRPR